MKYSVTTSWNIIYKCKHSVLRRQSGDTNRSKYGKVDALPIPCTLYEQEQSLYLINLSCFYTSIHFNSCIVYTVKINDKDILRVFFVNWYQLRKMQLQSLSVWIEHTTSRESSATLCQLSHDSTKAVAESVSWVLVYMWMVVMSVNVYKVY